ncbi:alcohol dehydrogenase catalytic domain-containing protein [Evansella sp. AB-P1]|uniref:zinc-dependent alcohol dehydrogenase n=1 Tax=Evansella sp. AB-P1 TaxID=3037653 RepID=UPI00241C64CA|nr:alcohol dehydrogenase catalytic domain-containing protein [Evansella sp. AB-P1]MDG5786741.1 alcohol dehydrogenase catalytic domain-containing protein [Evansella sp. AB-P1]
MKTLVWTGAETMKVEQQERPVVQANEVIIQVDVVGICGSEIEGYLGHNSLRVPPLVMGHEFCGRIVDKGREVSSIEIGSKVVVNPLLNCGTCDRCRRGLENLCDERKIIGIHRSGAFAEYVAVPASSVVVVSENLDSFSASLAEPLACCLRAVRRAMTLHPFSNVLIYGAGAIGLLSGFVAQILGANKVIIVDINDERLKTVQNVGFHDVINTKMEDLDNKLKNITGEKGVDVVIDAAGFLPTRSQAMNVVNPGGVIMNVGLGIDETPLPINQQIRSETMILGSFCYTKQDFYDAVQLLEEGKINRDGWSEIRPLENGQQAFSELVNGEIEKSKIFLTL